MKTILFVHGSSDLYGSSKILLSTVKGLDRSKYRAIVLLPYREILDKELEEVGAQVIIGPVAVMRRQNFNLKGALRLIWDMRKSYILLKKLDDESRIDFVYSSTAVVLTGALFASIAKRKHLWHVMEISTKPVFMKWLLPQSINIFSTACVAISNATSQYLISGGMRKKKITVVHSGIPDIGYKQNQSRGDDNKDIVIGMLGRISWLKGQHVFIEAAEKVRRSGCEAKFYIVGSYFGAQDQCFKFIQTEISRLQLDDYVKIVQFTKDVASCYQLFDISVVPSTQPESFGLVALEAMFMGKPVVASRIGGLPEIVHEEVTGLLVKPGDADALASALIRLARDPAMRMRLGEAGRKRQQELFTEAIYQRNISNVIREIFS